MIANQLCKMESAVNCKLWMFFYIWIMWKACLVPQFSKGLEKKWPTFKKQCYCVASTLNIWCYLITPREFFRKVKIKEVFPVQHVPKNTFIYIPIYNCSPTKNSNSLMYQQNPFKETVLKNNFHSGIDINTKWKRKIAQEMGN